MKIKEYDVGARNIHHNPNLKTSTINEPGDITNPISSGEASPIEDMFGNRGFKFGPETKFDYSKNDDIPVEVIDSFELDIYGENTMNRKVREDEYQDDSSLQSKQTASSFKFGDPTELDYSRETSGHSDSEIKRSNDRGAIVANNGKHDIEEYPESIEKVIEASLNIGMSYPQIRSLVEALEDIEKSEKTKSDKDNKDEDKEEKKENVIRSAMDLGLSESEILKVLEAMDDDVDDDEEDADEGKLPVNEAKKWMQQAAAKMRKKGTVGKFSAKAKAAGESTSEFARAHKHSKGKIGKEARFALNAKKAKH